MYKIRLVMNVVWPTACI